MAGLAGTAAVAALGATAAQGALPAVPMLSLPTSTTTSSSGKASGAKMSGRPVATNVLLCGTWMQGDDRISGNSAIDHPSGAEAMGRQYDYSGQSCEDEQGNSGTGMFTWTVGHSTVNVNRDRGTEHGAFTLDTTGNRKAGFNGHVTDYGFGTPISAADPKACGDRQVYYTSGQAYGNGCSPSGPGNFNTQGGAQLDQHFRGKYGTVVYQDDNNNSCKTGSQSYCFEAILAGQTN
jgi:hypothetical protein